MELISIGRSQETKLPLTSGGCGLAAFMLLVAVFDSLAPPVSCDLL